MQDRAEESISSRALATNRDGTFEATNEPNERTRTRSGSKDNKRKNLETQPQLSEYLKPRVKDQNEPQRNKKGSGYKLEAQFKPYHNVASHIGKNRGPNKRSRIKHEPANKIEFLDMGAKLLQSDYQPQRLIEVKDNMSTRTLLPTDCINDRRPNLKRVAPNIDCQKVLPNQQLTPHIHTNLFIHDKYAIKYSLNQVNSLLWLSKYSGRLSGVTFWLLFIFVAIILDYLKYGGYLLRVSTYEISSPIDAGIITSLRSGKFGWNILVVLILFLYYLIIEGFTSKLSLQVVLTSLTLLFTQGLIIVLSITRMMGRESEFIVIEPGLIPGIRRNNIVLIILVCAIWLTYQAFCFLMLNLQLSKIVKGLEFPDEISSILRRAGLEKAAAAKGTKL